MVSALLQVAKLAIIFHIGVITNVNFVKKPSTEHPPLNNRQMPAARQVPCAVTQPLPPAARWVTCAVTLVTAPSAILCFLPIRHKNNYPPWMVAGSSLDDVCLSRFKEYLII